MAFDGLEILGGDHLVHGLPQHAFPGFTPGVMMVNEQDALHKFQWGLDSW